MLVYRDADRPALVDAEAGRLDRVPFELSEGRGSARELATEALIEAGALQARYRSGLARALQRMEAAA